MQKANDSILQVRINQKLKKRGEQKAYDRGFGSLQDLVRWFIKNYSEDRIQIELKDNVEMISPSQLRSLEEDYRLFLQEKQLDKSYGKDNLDELEKSLEA